MHKFILKISSDIRNTKSYMTTIFNVVNVLKKF